MSQTPVRIFFDTVVAPAFGEIRKQLEAKGRNVSTRISDREAYVDVEYKRGFELFYMIKPSPKLFPVVETEFPDFRTGRRYNTKAGSIRSGAQDYTVSDISIQEVVEDFFRHYRPRPS